MTDVGSLFVTIAGKDVGLEQLLERVDKEMAKNADSAVRLGQSYARLAQAQGQPATAAQVLEGTMARAGSASEKALIGIQTQQTNLTNNAGSLRGAISSLGSQVGTFTGQLGQLGGQLSSVGGTAGSLAGSLGGLAGSLGTVGAVGAAIGIGTVALDLAKTGAQADLVEKRFNSLAAAAGTTGDALMTAMRAASGGEISDLNLQLAANRANLLGVATSADQMGQLMEIARDRAQNMGMTTTQAFDDLVTGLGRASPRILDNLGIVVNQTEANNAYAASLGKTASTLTDAEQKQALINAVLKQGQDTLRATGGAAETTAGQIAAAQASIDNLKNSVGGLIALQVGPWAADFAKVANALAGTGSLTAGLSGLADMGAKVNPSIQLFNQLTGAVDTAGAAVARFVGIPVVDNFSPLRDSMNQWMQLLGLSSGVTGQATAALQSHAVAVDEDRTRIGAGQAAQAAYATSLEQVSQATELSVVQFRASAAAADISGEAMAREALQKQTSAEAAQKLAQFQALLASLGGAVAGGHQTAGAAALALSQQYHIAYEEALLLINAQAQLAGGAVKAAKAQVRAADFSERHGGAEGGGRLTPAQRAQAATTQLTNAQIKADRDAAAAGEAHQNQLLRTGTAAQKAAVLQDRYNTAVKRFGAGSAEAIDAQTNLIAAQQSASKKGGAAKLSDQQKLENSLLSSQQQYGDQAEKAETEHQRRLLDIQQKYAEDVKKAQDALAQGQLESRASFYDTLGGVEDKGLQQSFSAQYEQAFQEADKIAQEKGADVAQKYLEARQQTLEARAKRAQEISIAEKGDKGGKGKDKDRAEYLRGVDKLYTAAEDRKLKAITDGGDSLAAQRDQQLADEAQNYADKQNDIITASGNAAERKIADSVRSGKAVDEEALKVGKLGEAYDKVGAQRPAGGAPAAPGATAEATATPATPATPGGPQTAAAAPGAAPTLADLISQLMGKLDSVGASIVSAEQSGADKVAGAVKNLRGAIS